MTKINYLATATAKVATRKREPVRQEVAGLEHYAAFVAVEKGVAALREAEAAPLKAELERQFLEAGCAAGAVPQNFHGREGAATASLQLRRKTIRSPLEAHEVSALRKARVPVKVVQATFQVAEKYMDRIDVLDKLNAALSRAGLPEDLFERTAEERTIVTDETVAAVFKKAPAVAAKLLPLVAAVTVSTQWNSSFEAALQLTDADLNSYEVETKTIEAETVTAARVQHLPVKTVTTAVAAKTSARAARVQPVGTLTKAQEKRAVNEGYRADKVRGSRSAEFAKGQWVWANYTDGAYLATVVAQGGGSIKVQWDGTTNRVTLDTDQVVAVNVPVPEAA